MNDKEKTKEMIASINAWWKDLDGKDMKDWKRPTVEQALWMADDMCGSLMARIKHQPAKWWLAYMAIVDEVYRLQNLEKLIAAVMQDLDAEKELAYKEGYNAALKTIES